MTYEALNEKFDLENFFSKIEEVKEEYENLLDSVRNLHRAIERARYDNNENHVRNCLALVGMESCYLGLTANELSDLAEALEKAGC